MTGIPLSGTERTSLEGFWGADGYVFTGTQVSVVSQAGDEVDLKANIEINADIISTSGVALSDGTTMPVEEAIKTFYTSYQTTNDFNSTLYIQDLERAILEVDGVINVVITACNIKPLGGLYSDVLASSLRKYTPLAGWLKEDSANLLVDNLTYLKA